jgi:hypothetical protein
MRDSLRLITLGLVLLAVPLQAAVGLHPHAPTTADLITLRSEQVCAVSSYAVSREGNQIRVTLTGGGCPTPPFPYAYEVPLGQLPAGRYVVTIQSPTEPESLEFVVRDTAPLVRVRPSVVAVNAFEFPLELETAQNFSLCDNPQTVICPSTVIELGGVRVDTGPGSGGTRAIFVAPNLTAGWKDLRVTNGRGTFVFPAAVYYHTVGSEPDVHAFERVLFPVLLSTGGLGGSSWRSEAVILNPTRFFIENANHVFPGHCSPYPCFVRLPPRARHGFAGEEFSRGVALLVPRSEADNLAFSLRVRDVSRDADNLGTEIPVVRESDMLRQPAEPRFAGTQLGLPRRRNNDVTLLDVPRDPRYRTKVRIYAFRVDPVEVYDREPVVRVAVATGPQVGTVLQEIPYALERTCNRAGCAATPAYAEIDLAPGGTDERVDLFVQFPEGNLGWALASVTNNTTQQVTIISPNGKGGRPCTDNC